MGPVCWAKSSGGGAGVDSWRRDRDACLDGRAKRSATGIPGPCGGGCHGSPQWGLRLPRFPRHLAVGGTHQHEDECAGGHHLAVLVGELHLHDPQAAARLLGAGGALDFWAGGRMQEFQRAADSDAGLSAA